MSQWSGGLTLRIRAAMGQEFGGPWGTFIRFQGGDRQHAVSNSYAPDLGENPRGVHEVDSPAALGIVTCAHLVDCPENLPQAGVTSAEKWGFHVVV